MRWYNIPKEHFKDVVESLIIEKKEFIKNSLKNYYEENIMRRYYEN